MVPFVILILFKFVSTKTITVFLPEQSSGIKPVLIQSHNYEYKTYGYANNIPMKDSGQGQYYHITYGPMRTETPANLLRSDPSNINDNLTDDDKYNYGYQSNNVRRGTVQKPYYTDETNRQATPTETLKIPVKSDTLNTNEYSPTDQGSNYGYKNNIVNGTAQGTYNTNRQSKTEQSSKEHTDTFNFSTPLVFLLGVLALLPTVVLAGFLLRKRICVKHSAEDFVTQEGSMETHEEMEYMREVNIANRPPLPLPPQAESIYSHYNTPYDHRMFPPPARPRNAC